MKTIQRLDEAESFKHTVYLIDDTDTMIGAANITGARMWYYNLEEDESADNAINGRGGAAGSAGQDVAGVNNCTIADVGSKTVFTWNGQPADAAFRDQTKTTELHKMKLQVTHTQGGSPFNYNEGFRVVNLGKLIQTES